ncbi:MAG: nicotinamide-nucleotide adenylyltransferase [Thermoplasmata archaeon]
MLSIFQGRFQPFHLGHLYALENILKKEKEIIILVENADESFTFNNPFTAGERIEMILGSINKRDQILIIPVENIKNNAQWVSYLRSMIPEFKRCYSNNSLVRLLMENAGVEVIGIDFLNREKYSGTEIRKRIALNKEWKDLVPKFVYEYIINKSLDKRIKNLYGE